MHKYVNLQSFNKNQQTISPTVREFEFKYHAQPMQQKSIKELNIKVSPSQPVSSHYDFHIQPYKFEVQKVADPFAIYAGKTDPFDHPNEAFYEYNLEGRSTNDILIAKLQDEHQTPNDFTRRLRNIAGEGDLVTLKAADDEFTAGLNEVLATINKEKDIPEKALPERKFRKELYDAVEKRERGKYRKVTPKLVIKDAFQKGVQNEFNAIDENAAAGGMKEVLHSHATETAGAEGATTEGDELAAAEAEAEVITEVFKKKHAVLQGKWELVTEVNDVRQFLAGLPRGTDVKHEHPETFARLRHLMKIFPADSGGSGGNLKFAGGILDHWAKHYSHLNRMVEEMEEGLEREREESQKRFHKKYSAVIPTAKARHEAKKAATEALKIPRDKPIGLRRTADAAAAAAAAVGVTPYNTPTQSGRGRVERARPSESSPLLVPRSTSKTIKQLFK